MTTRSRSRPPTGRSNVSVTSTVTSSPARRPLLLTLIPEEKEDTAKEHLRSGNTLNCDVSHDADRDSFAPSRSTSSRSRDYTLPSLYKAFEKKPWASPAVQKFTSRAGSHSEDSQTLVIEGRHGDVLTAVGSQRDHATASLALSRLRERGECPPAEQAQHCTPLATSRSSRAIAPSSSRRQFGSVYEYCDSFGKPQCIGHTGDVPEKQFEKDQRQHQGIKNLLFYQQGKPKIVWAGTSSASGGTDLPPSALSHVTESIVQERSRQHNLAKLRGPKPYSRHGY